MTRLPAFVAALALSILSGCSSRDQVDLPSSIAISPDFSTEQVQTILFALEQWKQATNGVADLSPHIGTDGFTIAPTLTDGGEHSGRAYVNGSTGVFRISIYTDPIKLAQAAIDPGTDTVLLQTVLHELGHTFGIIRHLDAGLMSPYVDASRPCIDALALESFCMNYQCPAGIHPTCAD